jgi:amino acid adenylation domain-containing protein
VNAVQAFITHHRVTERDRVLQFASLSFDVATEEFFAAWLGGACAVMRPGQVIGTHAEFTALLEKHRVSVVNLPASFWAEWLGALESCAFGLPETLRRVVVGNEKTLAGMLDRWRRVAGARVEWNNAYGPTETTITASNYEPSSDASHAPVEHTNSQTISHANTHSSLHTNSVPIGRPLMNAQMYILDRSLQVVPQGVVGELYIGGAGLARGYQRQPAQTAERFIPNPFSLKRGARLYRTGDLARFLPDGNIEFLGRVDEQVKIRGFRIELSEIESTLIGHPQVTEATVMALEDEAGEKRLVAYVVGSTAETNGDDATSPEELRRYLSERLPEYMIPLAFVHLRELPLTPNGKVDRKALPGIESIRTVASDAYVAPRSGLERDIACVWREMLKVERVGVDDNFFGLGGHSLLMVHVNQRLRELLQRDLSMIEMFKYPTVGALAEHLSRQPLQTHTPKTPHQPSSDVRLQAINRQRQLKLRRRAERQQNATHDA